MSESKTESAATAPDPRQRRRTPWWEWVVLLGVALLVAFLARTFVIEQFWIPSGSMEHTLNVHDRVLVYKLGYDFGPPERGDIIVFKPPKLWADETGDHDDWIKRVIGVGGDHVVCCDARQRITVNGYPLDETYLYRDPSGVQDRPSPAPFDIVVPRGQLWVMGDHRSDSADSRYHFTNTGDLNKSTVSVDSVVGRAFTLFWPVGRATWLGTPSTFRHIPDAKESQ